MHAADSASPTATGARADAITPRVWIVAPVTAADGPTLAAGNEAGLLFACKLGTDISFLGREAVEKANNTPFGLSAGIVAKMLTERPVSPRVVRESVPPAVEAAVCALAIRDGKIPPTINLENPDEECDLDYTPHVAREKKVRVALNNSFGFGGHNATLVASAFEG